MTKKKLRSLLLPEKLSETKIKILQKVSDVLIRWGGYDEGYWKIVDIAKELEISKDTVYERLSLFKDNFPEEFKVVKANRSMVRRVAKLQQENLKKTGSWEKLEEACGDCFEDQIKGKW